MCAMPVMPRDHPWTVEDLDDLPDDGLQYELADGILLVTPSPRPRHQRASMRLTALLLAACPPELEVFAAPFDFRPTNTTSLQPDLLVVRREDVLEEGLSGTPLLVVEILSPSTRAKDLVLKRALYAEAGVPSYWVVDPSAPSVTLLSLLGDAYDETGSAAGACRVDAPLPFPVSLVPGELLV